MLYAVGALAEMQQQTWKQANNYSAYLKGEILLKSVRSALEIIDEFFTM